MYNYNSEATPEHLGAPCRSSAACPAQTARAARGNLLFTHSLTVAIPPGGGIGGAAHNRSVSIPARVPSDCMYTEDWNRCSSGKLIMMSIIIINSSSCVIVVSVMTSTSTIVTTILTSMCMIRVCVMIIIVIIVSGARISVWQLKRIPRLRDIN